MEMNHHGGRCLCSPPGRHPGTASGGGGGGYRCCTGEDGRERVTSISKGGAVMRRYTRGL
uniref:Uncharacterized protein n=1 Tax=Oryza nivara TaxID=4536 RepID=A0A0E0J1A1_ORYNI